MTTFDGVLEPISASLRKDPAGDFSEGSLVANWCCVLEGFAAAGDVVIVVVDDDEDDEEVGR